MCKIVLGSQQGPRKSQCFNLSLEAGKDQCLSSSGQQQEFRLTQHFNSIQVFNWLDEAHPHQGGQAALLSPHTQNRVWSNVWAPRVQSS